MNSLEPSFRYFRPADIESVVSLLITNIPMYFVPAEEKELRDYLYEYPENYWIIDKDHEAVAAGGIVLNDDQTISLCWGMVRNDLIGTGLGKQLTLFRMEKAREKWGVLPFVTSTSHLTEGFYLKLGFQTIEHTPDGFGPGIDICKMRKET